MGVRAGSLTLHCNLQHLGVFRPKPQRLCVEEFANPQTGRAQKLAKRPGGVLVSLLPNLDSQGRGFKNGP